MKGVGPIIGLVVLLGFGLLLLIGIGEQHARESAVVEPSPSTATHDEKLSSTPAPVPPPADRPAAPPKAERSPWRVSTGTSKLTDEPRVVLISDAYKTVDCEWPYGVNLPSLIIRCDENNTVMYFDTGCHMTSSRYDNSGRVDLRVDNGRMFQVDMQESADREAIGLWNGGRSIPVIKRLFGGKDLTVRAFVFNHGRITFTIPIEGLREEIKPLRKACHW